MALAFKSSYKSINSTVDTIVYVSLNNIIIISSTQSSVSVSEIEEKMMNEERWGVGVSDDDTK